MARSDRSRYLVRRGFHSRPSLPSNRSSSTASMCRREKVSGTRFGSSAGAQSTGGLAGICVVAAQYAGVDSSYAYGAPIVVIGAAEPLAGRCQCYCLSRRLSSSCPLILLLARSGLRCRSTGLRIRNAFACMELPS